MVVLAGPIASGKTTRFRELQENLKVDRFNVDDRCAQLNHGSYQRIPASVVAQARAECEVFVREHIRARESFLVETTLRTLVAVEQARVARAAGFQTEMLYVALDSVEENIDRSRKREAAGGRDISEATIRAVHRASLGNLAAALREFDHVRVVDNTGVSGRVVLATRQGAVVFEGKARLAWLAQALAGTEYERAGG